MSFSDALGASESGGRYGVVNSEGYGGKYQFGEARLQDYRNATGQDFTFQDFVSNPMLQEEVQRWHIADIDRSISVNGLERYIGQNIGGVTLTRDGLRAMAHLGGVGGMTKFVQSGGKYNPADSNGTSLADYGKKFGGGTVGAATEPAQGTNSLTAGSPAGNGLAPDQNALSRPKFQFQNFQLDPNAFIMT